MNFECARNVVMAMVGVIMVDLCDTEISLIVIDKTMTNHCGVYKNTCSNNKITFHDNYSFAKCSKVALNIIGVNKFIIVIDKTMTDHCSVYKDIRVVIIKLLFMGNYSFAKCALL